MNDPSTFATYSRQSASASLPVLSEAVSVPVGIAGTVKECSFKNRPIANSFGDDIGAFGETSLVLTSTAFLNEVSQGTPDANLANGDYWVDYFKGRLHGKKADTSTSMTASYIINVPNVGSEASSGVITPGTSAAGMQNVLSMGIYNAAPADLTEGQLMIPRLDKHGNLNINKNSQDQNEGMHSVVVSSTGNISAVPSAMDYLVIQPSASLNVKVYNSASNTTGDKRFDFSWGVTLINDAPVIVPFNEILDAGIYIVISGGATSIKANFKATA